MKNFKISEKTEHTAIAVMITVIMGQFYFNPFNSEFRITIGVIVLTFSLLYFRDISIITTSFVTGISVFVFRSLIFFIETANTSLIIDKYLPAMFFYITFGIILTFFNVRQKIKYPFVVFFILSFSDVLSNIVEIIIRSEFELLHINLIVTKLFLSGFIRGFISLVLYWTFHSMKNLALKEEKRKETENLFLLSSKIISEQFYLQKSMIDIENAMETSYSTYKTIKESDFGRTNPDISKKLINLANNIHEIKKDYRRIVLGLDSIIPDLKLKEIMSIKEVYDIIMETNKRYDKIIEKKICIQGNCNTDLETNLYLSITSIINNLINNSVDAIGVGGKIIVDLYEDEENLIIKVEDNGIGIKEDDISYIFNPGFSTKYDKNTGKMSTGVGLNHVNNIATVLFKGEINVNSVNDLGTTFTIYIPISNLIKE